MRDTLHLVAPEVHHLEAIPVGQIGYLVRGRDTQPVLLYSDTMGHVGRVVPNRRGGATRRRHVRSALGRRRSDRVRLSQDLEVALFGQLLAERKQAARDAVRGNG